MPVRLARRALLFGAGSACLLPWSVGAAADKLNISGGRGSIDFAIGDSRVFRTTGSFKDWQGFLRGMTRTYPRAPSRWSCTPRASRCSTLSRPR